MPNRLKSLAEIAFDTYEAFAPDDKKFNKRVSELTDKERMLFFRIASRVETETKMRLNDAVSARLLGEQLMEEINN